MSAYREVHMDATWQYPQHGSIPDQGLINNLHDKDSRLAQEDLALQRDLC